MYGQAWAGALADAHQSITRLAGWAVIVFEIGFVAVFFVPVGGVLAILALAGAFHLATAVTMRLNVFFWAFVATYPAVWFWATQ